MGLHVQQVYGNELIKDREVEITARKVKLQLFVPAKSPKILN